MTQLEYELALEQWDAAHVGGAIWSRFVRVCEESLGRPWDEIRLMFDALYRAGVAVPPDVLREA